ncbi:hypothetical protein NBRC10512v2_003636 [Rhodotorula toruloides]
MHRYSPHAAASTARYESTASSSALSSSSSSEDEKYGFRQTLLDKPGTLQEWVKKSGEKGHHRKQDGGDGDDDDDGKQFHLSKHTKRIIIFSVLAVVILAGAFIAWKWGKSIWDHAVDFVTFPTVTTPLDLTSAFMSVVGDVTSHVVGAFSTATAAVAGAEHTATSAVAGAAETATHAVAGAAQTAVGAITKGIGGIFGHLA